MIVLGLGSNISSEKNTREDNIASAIRHLEAHPEIKVDKISSLYETEPVGLKEQPSFLNAVVSITTSLTPQELLAVCLSVEREMGRVREVRWGPRNIDIDLLIYHDVEMNENALELPHPRMPDRKFVLIPLREIVGNESIYKGKKVQELLDATIDDSKVIIYGTITV